ncbi:hypothetical protein GCM10010195_60770 [Kitasatospora griseola]|nr:hypothetical protein GCM10010195_60770 [Kitasatospora griseola]
MELHPWRGRVEAGEEAREGLGLTRDLDRVVLPVPGSAPGGQFEEPVRRESQRRLGVVPGSVGQEHAVAKLRPDAFAGLAEHHVDDEPPTPGPARYDIAAEERCDAEFGDILCAIEELDTDVISLEAARSHLQVTNELAGAGWSAGVGPGVWDIHSPRVPSPAETVLLLRLALTAVPPNACRSTPTAA